MKVTDEPGMLRVRLHDSQTSSGSGNNYATVQVVAEHAERAAFARQALAIKLRELDEAGKERDRLMRETARLARECRDLARECHSYDADLDAAIRGDLRQAV